MDIFYFSVDISFTDMMYLVILRSSRIKVVQTILSFTPKAETSPKSNDMKTPDDVVVPLSLPNYS
jgi:hypothetical protein